MHQTLTPDEKAKKDLEARIKFMQRKSNGLPPNNTRIHQQIDEEIDRIKNFDEKKLGQSELKTLYFGVAGAIVGLFVFAFLFYIGIFTVIYSSFRLYKLTKKKRYLIISVIAALTFIVLEGTRQRARTT